MKKCSKCKIEKEVVEFRKCSKSKDGLQYYCKSCSNNASNISIKNNKDKINARNRRRRKENPEKFRKYDKTEKRRKYHKELESKRRANNPEISRKINKKSRKKREKENPGVAYNATKAWRKNNPGRANAQDAKRRSAKNNATPNWITKEQNDQINEFYELAQELQWLSEEPLHVDHIVLLQGENISGLHVPWNLQILPRSVNCSKSNKFE